MREQLYQPNQKDPIYFRHGKTIIIISDVSQSQIDQIIKILAPTSDGIAQ